MAEPGIDALAPAIADAVRNAGDLAHARWQGAFDAWEKSPGQPVCDVDLEVDEHLKQALGRIDPAAGWLSEETIDRSDRLQRRRVWVVDPIDGTRDFIRRRPGWAVSVALVDGDQPLIAVLHAPATDRLWVAQAGAGVTMNGAPIAASPRTDIIGARVPADALPRTDRDLVAVAKPNSIALRIAMVAAGEADLLATLRWGHEWDIAAAVLIAREAGATTTDALGRKLRFNTPRGQAFGVVAAAPGIHDAAIARLRPQAVAALGR
ncbi:3'(2'),5'-bisphosphate nucleotidase CysQ [Sphingomonas sp. CJ99]